MKKDLYIFAPIEEFHAFMKFNAFLSLIRNDYNKIIAVVPEKTIGIISEADELLCASNSFLDEKGANYPSILEICGERNVSQFHQLARDYISKQTGNYDVLYYNYNKITDQFGNEKYPWFTITSPDCTPSYERDLKYMIQWMEGGNLLKPSQESFERIQKEYGDIVNENTYVMLTRNFKKKVVQMNSSVLQPNSGKFVQFLIDKGISIINVGYPFAPFDITNIKDGVIYKEIFPTFNQEDLFSLIYLSRGLFSFSGGLMLNCCCNFNVFLLENQSPFNDKYPLIQHRPKDKNVASFNFRDELAGGEFEKIFETISSIKENGDKTFSKPQKITFVA